MAVKIRLRRVGKRNAACHRIVVADGRSPRDGRFIENIGTYDPRAKSENIDLERADYWVGHGAQPSETVAAIIKRARAGVPMTPVAVAPQPPAVEPEPEEPEETSEGETPRTDAVADSDEADPEADDA